jgi:hypothetical protein
VRAPLVTLSERLAYGRPCYGRYGEGGLGQPPVQGLGLAPDLGPLLQEPGESLVGHPQQRNLPPEVAHPMGGDRLGQQALQAVVADEVAENGQ